MTTIPATVGSGYKRAERLMRQGWDVRFGHSVHSHRPNFTAVELPKPPCLWPGDPEWCPACGGAGH